MEENKKKFGKINRFILLGGTKILVDTAKYLQERKAEFHVFSSKRHLSEEVENGKTLTELLEEMKVEYHDSKDINTDERLINLVDENTLGISFSCSWIIKEKTINLFGRKIVNLHETRLPQYRGGGGFSWQILKGNKLGCCTLHLIDTGIDTGDIVMYEEFFYPDSCVTPADYFEYLFQKDIRFMERFIEDVLDGHPFSFQKQSEYFSTYWPRLNTGFNGYINWSWNLLNIYRFVCAFDEPYDGASTYLNDKRVFLRDCLMDQSDGSFHPFQAGIIFRKNEEAVFIAVNGGTLIVKRVLDTNNESVFEKLKVGDRFVNSQRDLDMAINSRVVYTSEGLRIEKG